MPFLIIGVMLMAIAALALAPIFSVIRISRHEADD